MSLLLCFSGQIGSGKSSVSVAVAQALGWQRTGFGDYLRAEIVRRGGDPNDRQSLQDLGQTLVGTDPDAFCRDVLAAGGFTPGDDFIIDGIRHIVIFEILARVSQPSDAKLLFLGAGEAARAARITSRTDATDFARASAHPVEAELDRALPEFADGHIDANQPLDHVLDQALKFVYLWRG
jgi:adenylate kinase family enzyme